MTTRGWARTTIAAGAALAIIATFIVLDRSETPRATPTISPAPTAQDPTPTTTPVSTGDRRERFLCHPADDPYCVNSGESLDERKRTARTMGEFFDGTLAGIHVDRHYDTPCDDWVEMKESDLARYPIPVPRDIPDGWTVEEPTGWLCGDRPLFVVRIITYDEFISFGVGRFYREDTFDGRAGEKLVSEGRIQGRPAVIIKPLSRHGSGGSWIAFKDGDDLIVFQGSSVWFPILRRAAESFPLD